MESVIEKITKKVVICLPTDSGLGKDINNISQSNQYPPPYFARSVVIFTKNAHCVSGILKSIPFGLNATSFFTSHMIVKWVAYRRLPCRQ